MNHDKDYNKLKYEIANELGINYNPEGKNAHLTTAEAGRLGGLIGGNMVRKMVKAYQENIKE